MANSLLLCLCMLPLAHGEDSPSKHEAIQQHLLALHSNDADDASQAAEALVAMGRVAVGPLLEELPQADGSLRREIVFLLGRIGKDASDAVGRLTELLVDDDLEVRSFAAFALGKIGPAAARAIPNLIEMSESDEVKLRNAAQRALGQIRTEADSVQSLPHKEPFIVDHADYAVLDVEASEPAVDMPPELLAVESRPIREGDDALARDATNAPTPVFTSQLSQWTARLGLRTLLDRPQLKVGALAVAAWMVFWYASWCLVLWLRPLWLFGLNESLSRFLDFRIPRALGGFTVSFRSCFLLRLFHFRPRILDAWVASHVTTTQLRFWQQAATSQHQTFVPLPVMLDGIEVIEFVPEQLYSILSKKGSSILIGGDAGAGKTCLACQLAGWGLQRRLSDRIMLPVIVRFDSGQPLVDDIREQIEFLIGGERQVSDGMLRALFKRQQILVIIDLVGDQADALERIALEAEALVFGGTIVTSRKRAESLRPAQLTLEPIALSGDCLSSFVSSYLADRDRVSLLSDSEFFDACRNLSAQRNGEGVSVLIAKLFADHIIFAKETFGVLDLPANVPALVTAYASVVNHSAESAQFGDRTVQDDVQRIARMSLARSFRPAAVRRTAALQEMGGVQPAARLHYLQDVLQLVEDVPGPGDRIRIRLDPLAEYLAAAHLVASHAGSQRRWESFVSQLAHVQTNVGSIESFLWALYECCLAGPAVVPGWVPAKIGRIAGIDAELLKQDADFERVRRSIDALSASDAVTRRNAAASLSKCGAMAELAIPPLVAALGDSDKNVFSQAAAVLKKIGRNAVPALCVALGDHNSSVRRMAAVTLGSMGAAAASAVSRLRESLRDSQFSVRAAAASALGAIGAAETVPELIQMLKDQHHDVRASGAAALGALGAAAQPSIEGLCRLLKDPHVAVRRSAVTTLGEIGPAANPAVASLIEASLDSDTEVALGATKSLLLIGPDAVGHLCQALRSERNTVRRVAAFALGGLGVDAKDAVGALVEALQDQDTTIRDAAAEALGRIHGSRPMPGSEQTTRFDPLQSADRRAATIARPWAERIPA